MNQLLRRLYSTSIPFLLVLPASTNFKLNSYSFGSGGTTNSSSTSYAANASSGEASGPGESSSLYRIFPGLSGNQPANVPGAPGLDNPCSCYNKLHFVVTTSSNPTDAKYALAVSRDNFVTTSYLKPDGTLSSSLNSSNYQTFSQWGGAGGAYILGLSYATTYQAKTKAYRGKFTDSPFGPTATASTQNPSLSFSLSTDTQSIPPFAINFGSLPAGTVTNSPQKVNVSFATNASFGGSIYLVGMNGGLKSVQASYTIPSLSGDLQSFGEGFGGQVVATSQTSGGPLTAVSPYNGSGSVVGTIDSTPRIIFTTTSPISGGTGSMTLKALASASTASASDYTENLTLLASASF